MRRCAIATLVLALWAAAAAAPVQAQLPLPPLLDPGGGGGEQRRAPARAVPRYANPVMPGDYPDPSIIRDGPNYWMAVTSSGWRPPFTVLHSLDLVNWHVAGAVMRKRPAWAKSDFWAPEIVKRGERFLVYYAAKNARRRHCIGVASASSPIDYFRDHGPVVCPPLGAIDPLAETDEHGRPYLIWKEDGNAKRRPTPIMAAPLSADGLRLAGPTRELFRNDATWEGAVVEAPTLARRGNLLYLIYSARRCCGSTCDYAMGAARAQSLLGPWEKHRGPILEGGGRFRCPGHSTVVDAPDGEQYVLYHAYSQAGSVDVGRQVLLDRLEWTEESWP